MMLPDARGRCFLDVADGHGRGFVGQMTVSGLACLLGNVSGPGLFKHREDLGYWWTLLHGRR